MSCDRVLNQREGDSDGHAVIKNGSSEMPDSEKSESKLCASMPKTENVPKDDWSLNNNKRKQSN